MMSKRKKTSQSKAKNRQLLKSAAVLGTKLHDRETPARYEYPQLANIASEFLDCYVILGFNPEGYAVQIVNARNPKELNGIVNIAYSFIAQVESEGAPPPAGD